MARCNLKELDGLGSMENIRELYLAYNEISDLSALIMLSSLEIVDLENNEITNIEQLENLAVCKELRNATLLGNPLEFPNVLDEIDERSMRARMIILSILPTLKVLDDILVLISNNGK
jgi:Leucine-rich repeat (LRR) protein